MQREASLLGSEGAASAAGKADAAPSDGSGSADSPEEGSDGEPTGGAAELPRQSHDQTMVPPHSPRSAAKGGAAASLKALRSDAPPARAAAAAAF